MRRGLLVGLLAMGLAGTAAAQQKTRVYVSESQSWEIKSEIGGAEGALGGTANGGARPQTAEIIKTFNKRCPELTITINKDKADFIVLLEHEGGKDLVSRDNKVVVFNKEGDAIYSGSTRSLGNAVKDSCKAIREAQRTERAD